MPKDYNLSVRVDTTLKTEVEKVLSTFGLTIGGTIDMLLRQIVREQAVPLTLSLDSSYALYTDLLEAQDERANGYVGRTGREVIASMEEIIASVKTKYALEDECYHISISSSSSLSKSR